MRPRGNQAGFTIIESTVALAVILGVLVGMLASLRAGTKGVVTGRQRSAALAVANEILEQARGRGYAEVGHDFDSDPTLTVIADPALALTGGILVYTGVSPAEPLAAASIDAGSGGGTSSNPLYPFSPHRWTVVREGTTYTATIYVTGVTPTDGDPYKRITTRVSWSPSQYASAARSVSLTTLLFDVVAPPDPTLVGEAEADSGSLVVTGSLSGVELAEGRLALPYAYGTVDSGFVRTAKGFAKSALAELTLAGATAPTGCSLIGLRAECPGAHASTGADNDSGTSPPDDDRIGPLASAGGTVAAGSTLSAALGAGSATSLSTGRSCWSCSATGVDDDDRFPYHSARAAGPATASFPFQAASAGGSLIRIGSGCTSDCAVATADRDDVGGAARMTSTAQVSYPAIDLATFNSGPAGYNGMVRVAPVTVSSTAAAGPAAAIPSTTGSSFVVQLYNGSGYTSYTVTPGAAAPASDPTTSASFSVNGANVVATTTLHWGPAVRLSTSSGGAVVDAQSSLTNWFWVEVHLVVTQGSKVADLTLHLDYGKVAASATYEVG